MKSPIKFYKFRTSKDSLTRWPTSGLFSFELFPILFWFIHKGSRICPWIPLYSSCVNVVTNINEPIIKTVNNSFLLWQDNRAKTKHTLLKSWKCGFIYLKLPSKFLLPKPIFFEFQNLISHEFNGYSITYTTVKQWSRRDS